MKIEIENYRGFDIYFDTDAELFQCICTEENAKESKSYLAVKKFVDEYKKANQEFKPFWAEAIPSSGYSGKYKIIGIRKDGRFVAENQKTGEHEQISDYTAKNYMIVYPENVEVLTGIKYLESTHERIINEYNTRRKELISQLKIVTLKDYKDGL